MGKKVLEVKDLVTTFRIGKKEYEVLRGVSFDIEENETLCMVGESGCGKSVTTLSIMDLLPNNGRVVSGSIKLNGQELTTLSPKERNALRGKQMGMIFQEPMTALNPLLTIGRQMTEGLLLHSKRVHLSLLQSHLSTCEVYFSTVLWRVQARIPGTYHDF